MGVRQSPLDLARDDARKLDSLVRREVRETRIALGLSQQEVGRRAGMSHAAVSRFETAANASPSLDDVCRLYRAVGLAASLASAPTGVRVRDAPSLRILARFAGLVAPPLVLQREVPLPGQGQLRAWDAAIVADRARAFVEVVSRLGDIQALSRYLAVKLRDDGRSSVLILVVGRTRANNAVLADHREALRAMLPLDGAAVARALRAGTLPAASGIIVL